MAPRIASVFVDGIPADSDPSTFDFGQNLRKVRVARDVSQEELADRMRSLGLSRISQTTISNWERRSDCPSGRFLSAASLALNVPAFVFFTDLDCESVKEGLSFMSELEKGLCDDIESVSGDAVS